MTQEIDYWKKRCEAAELVIDKFAAIPLHPDVTERGKTIFNDWQQLKSNPIQKEEEDEKEKIICAAIWYKDQPSAKVLPKNIKQGVVVGGLRHGYCIASFVALTGKRSVLPECGEYEQGFITSKDRFVNRIEAMIIAKESGQVTSKQSFEELYSEDLY